MNTPQTKSTMFVMPTAISTSAPTTTFGFGSSTTTGSTFPTFGFTGTSSSTPSTIPSSISGSFGLPPASTSSFTFTSITGASASTPSAGLSLFSTSTPAATSNTDPKKVESSLTSVSADKSITFNELLDLINKWTYDLCDQEQQIVNQVDQIKTWDFALNSNAEKIIQLHKTFDQQKLQQEELDRNLDIMLIQQTELEGILQQLERLILEDKSKDFPEWNTYKEAQLIDAKLQMMNTDLREIINCANSKIPAKEDVDPVTHVTRILNLFNASLESIDKSICELNNRLKDISSTSQIYRSLADDGMTKIK